MSFTLDVSNDDGIEMCSKFSQPMNISLIIATFEVFVNIDKSNELRLLQFTNILARLVALAQLKLQSILVSD